LEISKGKEQWAAFALLLVNLIYGASHVLAKGVMPVFLSPTVFILFRVLGAVVLFWMLIPFVKRARILTRDFIRLAACGLFGVTVNQLLFFHGLNSSSPMNAGIIMALNPIMVAVLSFFWLKERLTRTQWIGISIGALGAIALTTYGTKSVQAQLGDLFLLGNSLSYAVYLLLVKPLMQKYPPLVVITWVFTFGTFFLLAFPPLYGDLKQTDLNTIPWFIWLKIIYVVVGVTFLTYLLTVVGLKYVSSTVASAFIYVQPIFVITFSYLFALIGWSADYTNHITPSKLVLMVLIFYGVHLTLGKRNFDKKQTP
jgi:drug/metabolite transporter (DMT)-like permease